MAKQIEELEARVTTLEKLVKELASHKPKTRKPRQYTDEQKAAIRVRLLAGQEASRKKREAGAKAGKRVKAGNYEKVKPVEAAKSVEG